MGPDLFRFITPYHEDQSVAAWQGAANALGHLGSLQRQDTAEKNREGGFQLENTRLTNDQVLRADQQNWGQKKDAASVVKQYTDLIAQGTDEGDAAAAAMAPQMKLMGIDLAPHDGPGEPIQSWVDKHSSGAAEPPKPADVITPPGSPAPAKPKPGTIEANIAALPDELPGDETPGPQPAPTKPIKGAPLLSKSMLSPPADQGELPSVDERKAAEERIASIGGETKPVEETPKAAMAPVRGGLPAMVAPKQEAPAPEPPKAEAPKPEAAKVEAKPAEQAQPEVPVARRPTFRVTFRGEDLGVVDPNPPHKAAEEGAARRGEEASAGIVKRYKSLMEGAVKGAKSPEEAEQRIKQVMPEILALINGEAALKIGMLKAGSAGAGRTTQDMEAGQRLIQKTTEGREFKKTEDQLNALMSADKLLRSPDRTGVETQEVMNQIARARDSGALSEGDIKRVQGPQPLLQEIENWFYGKSEGDLSPQAIQRLAGLVGQKLAIKTAEHQKNYTQALNLLHRIPMGGPLWEGAVGEFETRFSGMPFYNRDDIYGGKPTIPTGGGGGEKKSEPVVTSLPPDKMNGGFVNPGGIKLPTVTR